MDTLYLNLAKECFTEAHIVIDHFHVIALALRQMDRVRTIHQAVYRKKFQVKKLLMKPIHKLSEKEYLRLERCFEQIPELKTAWKIVHQVRKIYWQKSWKKAHSQLRKVLWLCEQSCLPEMISLSKTLKKWKTEILNYHLSKTTNAYTEGIHSRFETIKRYHCGIRNIERFAKRLMFCLTPFSTIASILAHRVY